MGKNQLFYLSRTYILLSVDSTTSTSEKLVYLGPFSINHDHVYIRFRETTGLTSHFSHLIRGVFVTIKSRRNQFSHLLAKQVWVQRNRCQATGDNVKQFMAKSCLVRSTYNPKHWIDK